MLTDDETLVEDWQGLESELERLFISYGIRVEEMPKEPDQSQTEEVAVQEKAITRIENSG